MTRSWKPFALALALASPVVARGQYPPVPPPTPIPADQMYQLYYPLTHDQQSAGQSDVVLNAGFAQTVVVKVLNLTPYRMELTPASRALFADHMSRSRQSGGGSFLFAPVGVPSVIPPGTTDAKGTVKAPDLHPRNFVLAWEGWWNVPKTHLNWVVKDVRYEPCTREGDPATCTSVSDIYVGLWLTYESVAQDSLNAEWLEFIMKLMEEAIAVAGVLIDPVNPIAWAAAGFTTYGLVTTGQDLVDAQKTPDEGAKLYVSAYTIPDWNRNCFILNNKDTWQQTGHAGEPQPPLAYEACSPTTTKQVNSDAYDAGWDDSFSGNGPSAIVVLTSVLRGRGAHPTSRGANANDEGPRYGWLPVVSVAVMTDVQYEAAQALLLMDDRPPIVGARPGGIDLDKEKVVKEARKFRDKYGVQDARRAVAWAVATLGPEQRQMLRDAVLTLMARNPISKEQEEFLLGVLKQAEQFVRDWRKEG